MKNFKQELLDHLPEWYKLNVPGIAKKLHVITVHLLLISSALTIFFVSSGMFFRLMFLILSQVFIFAFYKAIFAPKTCYKELFSQLFYLIDFRTYSAPLRVKIISSFWAIILIILVRGGVRYIIASKLDQAIPYLL
jgi:hypothetical protein